MALLLASCGAEDRPAPERPADPLFEEVGSEARLDFEHDSGATGELYIAEIMGAGAALFDYDRDGDLDVYLVQGGALHTPDRTDPGLPTDRLLRNELRESGRLTFTDVTATSGIRGAEYGMGVAVADIDGDGWLDLYVTNYGPNRLWHNLGDGTFEDLSERSGVEENRWSVSATFTDIDRDGDLDLYVANYVDFRLATHRPCYGPSSTLDYCGPQVFRGVPDRLFRNRGDGTFEDASVAAGIAAVSGPGLGVLSRDFDEDGWADLYVTNDAAENFLWVNRGDGTFEERALLYGCAVSADGSPEASMGVTAGDGDGDGDIDLFVTHLDGETNTFYVNQGDGLFSDVTLASGLGGPSLPWTSFGTGWIDLEGDGDLDLLTVSGAIKLFREQSPSEKADSLAQRNQLFRNLGDGRFEEISAGQGEPFSRPTVSRGAAFGDLDNDGDLDVVVLENNGPSKLLLQRGMPERWIGLQLFTAAGGESAGARVELHRRVGQPRQVRWSHRDGSYASSHDPRVLFSLGSEQPEPLVVDVLWPDGRRESWQGLEPGLYHSLRQGAGTEIAPPDPESALGG